MVMLDSLRDGMPEDNKRDRMLEHANRVDTTQLSDLTDPRLTCLYHRFSQFAAALTVLIGLGTLAFWLLAQPRLMAVRPNWIAMMPNRDVADRWRIPVATVCCALAIAIGAASLLEDITGVTLGIDELLFPGASDIVGMFRPPGRPGPATSALLITLALALFATILRLGRLNALCSTLALFMALTLMVAYVLNAHELYTFGNSV